MELTPPLKWYPLRFRDEETLEPVEGAPYLEFRRATGRVKLRVESFLSARYEQLSGDDTTIQEAMSDDDVFDLVMRLCIKYVTGSHGFEFKGRPIEWSALDDYPPQEWLDEHGDDPLAEYDEPTKYGVLNRLGQGSESWYELWNLHKQIIEGLDEDQKKASLKLQIYGGATESTDGVTAPSATDKPTSKPSDACGPTSS